MTAEEELVERITRAARAGGASEFDLATLRLRMLEGYKFQTIEQAMKVKRLESRMSDSIESGERCVVICEILGISERRFYQLKEIAIAIPDCSASQ